MTFVSPFATAYLRVVGLSWLAHQLESQGSQSWEIPPCQASSHALVAEPQWFRPIRALWGIPLSTWNVINEDTLMVQPITCKVFLEWVWSLSGDTSSGEVWQTVTSQTSRHTADVHIYYSHCLRIAFFIMFLPTLSLTILFILTPYFTPDLKHLASLGYIFSFLRAFLCTATLYSSGQTEVYVTWIPDSFTSPYRWWLDSLNLSTLWKRRWQWLLIDTCCHHSHTYRSGGWGLILICLDSVS